MKRYDMAALYGIPIRAVQRDNGDWVRYEDAKMLIEALNAYMNADKAGSRTPTQVAMLYRLGLKALNKINGE